MTERMPSHIEPTAGGKKSASPERAPFQMRRIGRHTLVYGMGKMAAKSVSFVMLPIYTRFLTPADYGVIQLVEMTLDLVAVVGGAQLVQGIFRFYHEAETEDDRNAVVSTAFFLLGASYLAVGTVALILAPVFSQVIFGSQVQTTVIRIAAGSLACQGLMVAPMALLQVRAQSKLFVAANLGKLVLQVGLNLLLLVYLGLGVRAVFLLPGQPDMPGLVGAIRALGAERVVLITSGAAASSNSASC